MIKTDGLYSFTRFQIADDFHQPVSKRIPGFCGNRSVFQHTNRIVRALIEKRIPGSVGTGIHTEKNHTGKM